MIKQAYMHGFINKLAAYGMSWSDIVDSPFLQKQFSRFFKYPKVEPGPKAVVDRNGRIVSARDIVRKGPQATSWKDTLKKYDPIKGTYVDLDLFYPEERTNLWQRAGEYAAKHPSK